MDFYINPLTNDWEFDELGNLKVVTGREEVAQRLRYRLNTHVGEWVLNVELGVPWREEILKKAPDLQVVGGLLRTLIVETPGVDRILRFDLDVGVDRILILDFAVGTTEDEVLEATALPNFAAARAFIRRRGTDAFADLVEEQGYSAIAKVIRRLRYAAFPTLADTQGFEDLAELQEPNDWASVYVALWTTADIGVV